MGGPLCMFLAFTPCTFLFSSLFAATRKSKDEVYTCPGGATIPKRYLCDKVRDCRDNSDELNCPEGKSKLIDRYLISLIHLLVQKYFEKSVRKSKFSLNIEST